MVGGVVDLKCVLIPWPGRIRRLRHRYTRVLPVRPATRATEDPSIGVSIEPHHRIAPVLTASAVRLVMPEGVAADGTGQNIARLVVNHHRSVDDLHVIVVADSSTVIGGEVENGTIIPEQVAYLKPIEAQEWI